MFLEMIGLLGRRTAELHLALASRSDLPEFAPEPPTRLHQVSLYQSMQRLVRRVAQSLEQNLGRLAPAAAPAAQAFLEIQDRVLRQMRAPAEGKMGGMRIRIHGDYHLGQVLWTGKDFVIVDFEGEPGRSAGERRRKHSALKDVAAMLRSFQYAAQASLLFNPAVRSEDAPLLEAWLAPWQRQVSDAFVKSYLKTAGGAPFLPPDPAETGALLRRHLLARAVYEIDYELRWRPEWLPIPLKGVQQLIAEAG